MRQRLRKAVLCIAGLAVPLLIVAFAPPVGATPSCATSTFYESNQNTQNGEYEGVYGSITDPSASYLQGNSGNSDDSQHIVLWLTIDNENPPASCKYVNQSTTDCWQQIGVGMGIVGSSQCANIAKNWTNHYEVYYENMGVSTCSDNFYAGIAIGQQSTIYSEEFYDGGNGPDGYPQFQGWVQNDVSQDIEVSYGDLYYSADHAVAGSEAYSGTTTACPFLSNTSPWQNFGADAAGAWDNGAYELYLETTNGVEDWASLDPSPSIYRAVAPFYYDGLKYSPDQFRSNGPSTGPA
jgi:hypothetical protein